jgi:hypothetical protein
MSNQYDSPYLLSEFQIQISWQRKLHFCFWPSHPLRARRDEIINRYIIDIRGRILEFREQKKEKAQPSPAKPSQGLARPVEAKRENFSVLFLLSCLPPSFWLLVSRTVSARTCAPHLISAPARFEDAHCIL